MANKIENLLKGLGSVEDVTNAILENHGTCISDHAGFVDAVNKLKGILLSDTAGNTGCCAAIASILNTELPKSMWIWYTDSKGRLDREAVSSDSVRAMIANAIA